MKREKVTQKGDELTKRMCYDNIMGLVTWQGKLNIIYFLLHKR